VIPIACGMGLCSNNCPTHKGRVYLSSHTFKTETKNKNKKRIKNKKKKPPKHLLKSHFK
jgi:hypothetical protein